MSSSGILSRVACALFVACSWVAPAQASERHALLIGISDYPGDKLDLEGPIHDVSLLRGIMIDRRIVAPSRIETLVDQEAGKHDIKRALHEHARERTRGDTLFVYLSGHGTSPTAEDYLPLPHTTGAFVPGDYESDAIDSVDEYVDALIVGRRDLRPHLETLDRKGVRVLIAIDACYSEFTSRSLGIFTRRGDARYMRTPDDLKRSSRAGADCSECGMRSAHDGKEYPYRHVFTIAAAGTDETALDLPRAAIDDVPTMDMKPHGAFSDSFARALAGQIHSDTNNDGVQSNTELFRATRRFMRQRGIPHTPHAYPTMDDDAIGIAFEAFLSADGIASATTDSPSANEDVSTADGSDTDSAADGASDLEESAVEEGVAATDAPTAPEACTERTDDLRVRLGADVPAGAIQRITATNGIRRVDSEGDMDIVADTGGGLRAVTAGGDLLDRFAADDEPALAGVLRQQKLVKRLSRTCNRGQTFNVTLDLDGVRQAGHLYAGDRFGLIMSSERRAHLAVYSITPRGRLHPLYPYTKAEAEPAAAREVVRFPGEGTELRVKPPYGTDYVLTVAFADHRPAIADLVGRTAPLSGNESLRLVEAVTRSGGKRAAALIKVNTRPPRTDGDIQ